MSIKLAPRYSKDRGNTDIGWLKSFHTFSVPGHFDPNHTNFGPLRVINEDRVEAHTGFGPHPHREFEIFSYVISGELDHGDSMSNREILKRGDVQMTSAGTGIRHSEKSYGSEQTYFLQIWALPSQSGLKPQYFTRHFSDEEKKDKWAKVVAPVGTEGVVEKRNASGPAPIHSPITMFAALISPSTTLTHTLPLSPSQRKAYMHIPQTSGYKPGEPSGSVIKLITPSGDSLVLREGDGAYIIGDAGSTLEVRNEGDRVAEVVLFDVEDLY